MSAMTLSIIVPAYNEQENIADAIHQITSDIPASVTDYEVIIVDDGSSDGTGDILRSFTDPRIKCCFHSHNLGKGASLITGFRLARMDWVLYLDADLQIDISHLEQFLEEIPENDAVIGCRQMRQDPLSRLLISRFYAAMVRAVLGFRLRDLGCPFKLIRKTFLDDCRFHSSGFFIDTELMYAAFTNGLRISEVGVTCQPRQKGKSTVRFRHMLEMMLELLKLLQRR